MEIKTILEYQKKDSEKIKLDRKLSESPAKKGLDNTLENSKKSKIKSAELDGRAGFVINENETLKKAYEQNLSMLEVYMAKGPDGFSEEELNAVLANVTKISQNLNVLDKKISQNAEEINRILGEFNRVKELNKKEKDKYNEFKQQFDLESAKIQPEIDRIVGELKALEDRVDREVLAKYKIKRQDRIFPVFVPLSLNSCGGCHMELPSAVVSKLKVNGYLECENCRRIIYII